MTETPKKLVLHVGHGKTGSSAIQSAIALSLEALKGHGIYYPDHGDTAAAGRGETTSGNAGREKFVGLAKEALLVEGFDTVLFSSEGLFQRFAVDDSLAQEVAALNVPVEIILFVRDPIEYFLSVYGQSVKRQGFAYGVDSYPTGRTSRTRQLQDFLPRMEALGFGVKVFNYQNHKKHLVGTFAEALGVPAACFTLPDIPQVNRSLTLAEAELQRKFNLHYGEGSSRFVSDRLADDLPDIRPEPPLITRETYDRLVAFFEEDVALSNALLPEAEQLRITPYEDLPGIVTEVPDSFTFNSAQLDVLAKSISERMMDSETISGAVEVLRARKPGQPLSELEFATLLGLVAKLAPEITGLQRRHDRLMLKLQQRGELPVIPSRKRSREARQRRNNRAE